MLGILRAYERSLHSLFFSGLLRHFVWPVLAAGALWTTVGVLFWGRLSHALTRLLQRWSLLTPHLSPGGVGEQSLATSIHVLLYLLSLPLVFVTAVLLLEMVALPMILEKVARTEYPEIERRRGGSQWQSIRRTLLSFVVAAAVMVLSLPAWLVPGLGAAILFGVSAWLNHRSFSYDVLMTHADAAELAALPARHRNRLLLLALGAGALTLVPVVNLIAVAFSGLSFAHYLLPQLQRERRAPGT